MEDDLVLVEGGWDAIAEHPPKLCRSISYEFTGIYPIMDTLPLVSQDSSYWAYLLKLQRFNVERTIVGSWDSGPRKIIVEMARGECECKVQKVYYNNDRKPDGTYNLRVSERLECNGPTARTRAERELEEEHEESPHGHVDKDLAKRLRELKVRLERVKVR